MGEAAGLLVLLLVALVAAVVLLSAIVARAVLRPPRHTAGYAVARRLAIDPGEAGFDFQAWVLERPGGGALPVWEIDAARRNVEGPRSTAVFIHDWGESRIDVLSRIQPWPELVDRLVLYDRRGHGEARGGAQLRAEDGDVPALLEHLGEGPYLLVATGTGAGVAIPAAARCGAGRIAGIVAERPVLRLGPWLRQRWRSAGHPQRPLADLALLWLALCRAGPGNVNAEVARLRCALLVVDGPEADALAAAVPGSRVMHQPSLEALRGFVDACLGRGAQPDAPHDAPPLPAGAENLVAPLAGELGSLAVAAYRHARRVVVLVVGASVLLVGVALLFLPGPGLLVILLGLAILGVEFAWARLWLGKIRRAAGGAGRRLGDMVKGS